MKTPEEIARAIMEACCLSRDGIEPMVVEAIRKAEIRGVALGITYCEKSLEASGQIIRFARSPESIVAARSAGTVPPAANPAPAPDAPCDFCLGRREVQKMAPCPQCRGSST